MADQSTVKGGIERFRQAGRQHRWTTNIILGKRSQTHIFKSSKQGMHRKCQCWLGLDIKVEIDWNERLKNNRNILKLVLRRNRNSYFFPYLWPLLAKKKKFPCVCVFCLQARLAPYACCVCGSQRCQIPGTGVTGNCRLSWGHLRIQTWIIWKNTWALIHVSSSYY